MKRLLSYCLTLGLLATQDANTQDFANTGAKNAAQAMRGAYQMTRQVVNYGNKDTLYTYPQLKIYTGRHFMYVHPADDDSLAVYGIGTYAVENGKVIENVFYTSGDGPVKDRYELTISKLGDGYTQVIHFPAQDGSPTLVSTEDYKRVDKKMTSPLDGVWKQTKNEFIDKNGKTYTTASPTQFKIYQSGNYMWANTYKDSATGKPASVYGYGTFRMTGKDAIVEQTANSSFKSMLVGKPVTVRFRFTDKNHYEQTIQWPEGKQVEYYERME